MTAGSRALAFIERDTPAETAARYAHQRTPKALLLRIETQAEPLSLTTPRGRGFYATM